MSKKKSIISYEKLTVEQKKLLLMAFPDGFAGETTKMTNPITGEVFDSLLWDTEEVTYLVKLPKLKMKAPSADEDDDDELEDEMDKFDGADEDDSSDDEEEDDYGDKADDEPADEDED